MMGLLTSLNGFPNLFCAVFQSKTSSSSPPPPTTPSSSESDQISMTKYIKHIIHVIVLLTVVISVVYGSICHQDDCHKNSKFDQYGPTLTILATAIQLTVILPIPQILCNIFGLLFFNAFPGTIAMNKPKIKSITNGNANGVQDIASIDITTPRPPPACPNSNLPHLCFRVVTRGLYPELVHNNVRKNFLTCIESGLINFSIEVVTDKDIQLTQASDPRVKQLVVPTSYKTSTGAMFKARALQYALEPGTSEVKDEDYIVHLDEETILTQNVINGVMNFALEGKHDFGQGLITYVNIEIVNLFTALADSYRVADDMGKMRFTLGALHKPIFGWKGSFVVTRCGSEKDVSFDHGPDGSIAEDCYFSMIAYNKGYSFDFIQGEMYEKSPFTILDLIRQRKRWVQGIWLVVHSSKIPIKTKFFLAMSHYAWLTLPITSLSYVITLIFPLPTPYWLQPLGSFCFAVTLYMYIFGVVKSFDLKKGPIGMLFVYMIGSVLTLTLNMIVENVAVIWGIFSPKYNFYIVKKDQKPKALPDV